MVRQSRAPRALLVVLFVIGLAVAAPSMASAAGTHRQEQAQAINDSGATRRVQILAGALGLGGLALAGLTIWFWRATKPLPDVLAPLEVMSKRRWARVSPAIKQRWLEEARPDGLVGGRDEPPVEVDLVALAAERSLPAFGDHGGFGDLADLAMPGEGFPAVEAGQPSSSVPVAEESPTELGRSVEPVLAVVSPVPPPPAPRRQVTPPPPPRRGVVFDQVDHTDLLSRPVAPLPGDETSDETSEVSSGLARASTLPFRPFRGLHGRAQADPLPLVSLPPPASEDLVEIELPPFED